MKIFEVTRIKLGSNRSDNTDAFLSDLEQITSEHPFDRKSRILKNATVEVVAYDKDIYISDIRSLFPRTGAGTEAMKILTGLADKHSVKLYLTAKAYSSDPKYVTDTTKLIEWYSSLGFEVDADSVDADAIKYGDYEGYDQVEMVYYPQ